MTRTAASDSVLRLALAMLARDPRSSLTAPARQALRDRLQVVTLEGHAVAFTARERAAVREQLLDYIATHHPRILAIVTQQFRDEAA